MNPRRARFFTLCVVGSALVLSACSDWATWGDGNQRQGENTIERGLSRSNVGSLQEQWAVSLGRQINASPILANNVDVNGTHLNMIYTGTEDGDIFAVTTNGAIIWSRHIGSEQVPCTEMYINGVHGMSASAVFDRARNAVYAVSGDGYVYALNASTGDVIAGWPIQLTSIPLHEVVWSAPTLTGNHLYIEIASHCDDVPYHGRIIDIDPQAHTIVRTFYVTGSATGPDGGGIWGWGGVSVDPADGDVYAATGNVFTTPENTPYGESVVRLSSSLVVKAYHSPTVMINDDDFGSTPVLFQKSGCPPQLAVIQKNGSLYVYDRDAISNGPRQRVDFGKPELIGLVAYSTVTQMLYAVNGAPSNYIQGLAAFRFDANCMLTLAWDTFLPVTGSAAPAIANGVVYVSGGLDSKIYALDATTGAKLWDSGTAISGETFPAPIVADGHVYAVAYDGKLHAFGL